MAATPNVARRVRARKSVRDSAEFPNTQLFVQTSNLRPAHGVVTLTGYGISVRVDRGHLVLEDGIGIERRQARLSRVAHGLKRLVVIGSDGHISLSALHWLADQRASFSMLDRDGSVLLNTGPVRPSEAKLRRAQAVALHNGVGFRLSREIIDRKLTGQQRVASEALGDERAALRIKQIRSELAEAGSIDALRLIESQGAKVYWAAWRSLPIAFPRKDLPRVPDHWQTFGARVSPLTGSPRLAANPVNAILNYLYAILEAEARLATATLGLDPGIGVLHVDTPSRDSLACDLMEVIRPDVDAFVLDWLKRDPLSRNFFFEERNGNCRLMADFASSLSKTAPTWARLVAPVAEWFAKEIYQYKDIHRNLLPSRLTQQARRVAQGGAPAAKAKSVSRPDRLCLGCGETIERPHVHCSRCMSEIHSEQMTEVVALGRQAKTSPEAQAKRSNSQRMKQEAARAWDPKSQPKWLTHELYSTKVQPRLTSISCTLISKRLNVSYSYADQIRKGRVPHKRHWKALAELAEMSRK